jgi:3,4-dihydroxy 2-butanone 4-phosphate synthase/GTP cyclohydrolase II
VQSAPPPWGFLNPDACRLARQGLDALAAVRREGRGVVVFMHLDGRDHDNLRRSFGQDFQGSVEVSSQRSADALRDLGTGCQILLDLGLRDLRLLTNNDRPIVGIDAYGLRVVERVPLVATRAGA